MSLSKWEVEDLRVHNLKKEILAITLEIEKVSGKVKTGNAEIMRATGRLGSEDIVARLKDNVAKLRATQAELTSKRGALRGQL